MHRYYTIVGSRDTPEQYCVILTEIAKRLGEAGWVGRSGGADGADSCLEAASPPSMEIYLPWDNFNSRNSKDKFYIDSTKLRTYSEAVNIASQTHPAWERCSRGAKALHTRNVYQVLGYTLKEPSKFLICWAVPTTTGVKGGTNTAVQLAKGIDIPIINVYSKTLEEVMDMLVSLDILEGSYVPV